MSSYCEAPECERETREGRTHCDLHEKRRQRRKSLSAPIVEKVSLEERLLNLYGRYAEADGDDEYRKARRALLVAAREFGQKEAHGLLVREGMQRARERGVHIGRPRRLTWSEASAAVSAHGGVRAAAKALGVSRRMVQRALKRQVVTKGDLLTPPENCPRQQGG